MGWVILIWLAGNGALFMFIYNREVDFENGKK